MKIIFRSLLLIIASLFVFTGCRSGGPTLQDTQQTDSQTSEKPIPSPLPTEPYLPISFKEHDNICSVTGDWRWENGSIKGENLNYGNCFLMTDLYTTKGVPFSMEADIRVDSGRAVGIVLGVEDQDLPTTLWYCFNVDKSARNTRLFANGEGADLGNGAATQRALTEAEINTQTYHFELEYSAKGYITCYLNDKLVTKCTTANYAGGYLGFYSYYANCTVSNITYKIGDIFSPAMNMELEVDGKIYPIDPNALSASIDLGQTNGKATLRFAMLNGYEARVGKSEYFDCESVEHTFVPAYGESEVSIVFVDADKNKSSLTLLLKKQVPDNVVYTDLYRPQYHFSPQMYFMNDPNGLVYNATTQEYHLFYQYSPGLFEGMGNQVWGHAVSKDLVNWTELGIAIDREDNGGKIYSGSAVIDYNNTTGFFDASIPPASRMVVIYTVPAAPSTKETQNLAYSLDNGYTWIKYDGNPVLVANAANTAFRDPKIRWIEDSSLPNGGVWLAVVGGAQSQIFTSPDLKNWTFNSNICDFDGKVVSSECPDLFYLALNGDENNMKWVYSGSGLFYIVGDLVKTSDGKFTFQALQSQRTDYVYSNGRRFYATQSYFNTPSGETVSISWSRDGTVIKDKYWSGCMTLAYKVGLVTFSDGSIRLTHIPVEAVDTLRGEKLLTYGKTTWTSATGISAVKSANFSISSTFQLNNDSELRLDLFSDGAGKSAYVLFKSDSNGKVSVTVSTATIADPKGTSWTIPLQLNADETIDLRVYGDSSIIEIFINGGRYTFCERIFPSNRGSNIAVKITKGSVAVEYFDCYEMKSIWN